MSLPMLAYHVLRLIPPKLRWWVASRIDAADTENRLCWAELSVRVGLCDLPWDDWPHFSAAGCGGGPGGQCWCGKIERSEP